MSGDSGAPTRTSGVLAVLVVLAGTGGVAIDSEVSVPFALTLVGVAYLGIGASLATDGTPVRDIGGSVLLYAGALLGTGAPALAVADGPGPAALVACLGLAVAGVGVGVTTGTDDRIARRVLGGTVVVGVFALVSMILVTGGTTVIRVVADLLGLGVTGLAARSIGWLLLAVVLCVVAVRRVDPAIRALLLLAPAPNRSTLYPSATRERVERAASRLQKVVIGAGVLLAITVPSEGAWSGLLELFPGGIGRLLPNPGVYGPPAIVGDPGSIRVLGWAVVVLALPSVLRWVVRRIDRTRFRSTAADWRDAVGGVVPAIVFLLAVGPVRDVTTDALPPVGADFLTGGVDAFGAVGLALALTAVLAFSWALVLWGWIAVERSGLVPPRSAGVAGGAAALFGAAVLGSTLGTSAAAVVVAVIASLAAWDLGEYAVDLGSTTAGGVQVELLHAAGTLGVALAAALATVTVAAAGTAVGTTADGPGALLAALVGGLGLLVAVRLLRA